MSERAVELRLRGYLGARLGPLALLLVVVTSLSAPLAFWVLGRDALSMQAASTARQVAELIRGDAQQRPLLWKYDSLKLLAHMRSYELREGIAHIEVIDGLGRRIEGTGPSEPIEPSSEVVWASAPVQVNNEQVGEVWVAASTVELRRETTILWALFSGLGLLLGVLMYWLPMRAMGTAQQEISGLLGRLRESQSALASLNQSLEEQVEIRSSQLQRAVRELQDKEKNLRELSSRAVGIQEAERRRIARELHDSAGQALTAIRIHLQLMNDLLATAGADDARRAKLSDMMVRTTSMVDDTVEEIRRAVNMLGPAVLDDVGLAAAIQRAADDLFEVTGIEVQCSLTLPVALEAAVETTCYRVIQEALTNVARHSGAKHVEIEVRSVSEGLAIEIRDDGAGFDPGERPSDRRGLVGMRERVQLLGGSLELDAAPGRGVRIHALVPTKAAIPC